ncbi:MAG: hypothetical protein GX916_12240 [Clostridiales bacterium]|nr:hypothetical protein [Clostridiales bacterium]
MSPLFAFFAALMLLGIVINALVSRKRSRVKKLDRLWASESALKQYDDDILDDIASYWRFKKTAISEADQVDDTTWDDLDMNHVFRQLDSTISLCGSEVLYAMLHGTGEEPHVLAERSLCSDYLVSARDTRIAVQMALQKIKQAHYHGAAAFMRNPEIAFPPYRGLLHAMGFLPVVLLMAALLHPAFLLAAAGMMALNAMVYFRAAPAWRIYERAVKHLASVLNCAKALDRIKDDVLKPQLSRLRALCKPLNSVKRWTPVFAVEGVELIEMIVDYLKIFFLFDLFALSVIVRRIGKQAGALQAVYEAVGTLDVCQALAALKTRHPAWCSPRFTNERYVEAEDMTHPLVRDCVPNSFQWQRGMLLTGSNASGKSTFVKAVAINAILAQSLSFCFAQAFVLPCARVMTSMAIRDDVRSGDSYFIREIKSLRRILQALDGKRFVLCFIDEILRGTNTVERIASSSAVLAVLAEKPLLCLAATHDIELTRLLADQYDNMHFREEMKDGNVVFNYQLCQGPSTTRNAVALLSSMGFDQAIIDSAHRLIAQFEQTGSWFTS